MMLAKLNVDRRVLADSIPRFRSKRILVLGDVMLDRFIWGVVSRISPEAPVPVVDIRRETSCLGGAANVSANVRSLGAIPVPVGVIGNDGEGRRLKAEFRKLGVPVNGLVVDPDRTTSVKTRIIAHHQQVCRTDREDRRELSPVIENEVCERFRDEVGDADAVVVSDYAKGLVSPGLMRKVLPIASAREKIVCVDPKLSNLAHYRPATVITPNTMEAERASGITIHTVRDLIRAGKKILHQTKVEHLLVTRGEEGMALFEGKDKVSHIPTVAREVFDVTGAGDTVISTLTLGLVAGLTVLQAAVLANFAAGIVVGKLGTASVTPEELLERIQQS